MFIKRRVKHRLYILNFESIDKTIIADEWLQYLLHTTVEKPIADKSSSDLNPNFFSCVFQRQDVSVVNTSSKLPQQ